MKVVTKIDEPYGDLLERYFQERFPKVASIKKSNLLEILTDIFVGSKNIRYGPSPKPERLVAIRRVISEAIHNNVPIPILVPWGGTKPVLGELLDVADISGLFQLVHLDQQVRRFYSWGTTMNVRIEDAGAMWLYHDQENNWDVLAKYIENYSNSFVDAIKIVRGDSVIHPMKEGNLLEIGEAMKMSNEFSEIIFNYLVYSNSFPKDSKSSPAYKSLLEIGWKGEIPFDQRDYYISLYKRLDPNQKEDHYYKMLSDYLAWSLARYKLHATAEPETDFGYLKLSFTPPIPGVPNGLFDTTLYYRTVSADETRNHIAPWRAKGYIDFMMNKGTTKIASWNDGSLINSLFKSTVELHDGDTKIEVRADYTVTDPASLFLNIPII
jgi:hypothetical protein